MELNTREIATLIWLAIFVLACILHPKLRSSLADLAKDLFQAKILAVIAGLACYIILMVWVLSTLSLWGWDQLKNTLIWSTTVGFASLFRIPGIGDNPRFFREWAGDNLKATVLVEFLVGAYTFPLSAELLAIPFVTFLVGMVAVGERDEQYRPAVNVLNMLLAAAGIGLVVYAARMAFSDLENFASMQTLRDLYTPILLSLMLVPFMFVLHVYMTYETVFGVMGSHISDEKLRRYAKLRAVLSFGPSTTLLRRWLRNITVHQPQDRNGIRQSIVEVKDAKRREENPAKVPISNGWSPNIAKAFLTGHGLISGDYHRLFDEWFSSTPYLELGDGLLRNNLAYYVEGNEQAAKRLKLVLHVNNPADSVHSEATLREIGKALLDSAIPGHSLSLERDELDTSFGHWHIQLTKDMWEGGIPGGYTMRLVIETKETGL